MDPWTKLNFQKIQNLEFGISWMYFVCQNVVFLLYLESWKVVHSEISFILTNLSLPWLKCCTKEAWLKLKFSKHPENRTWTFLNVFSLSKCHHSHTFEIVISNLSILRYLWLHQSCLFLVCRVLLWIHGWTEFSKTSKN